MNAVSRWEVAIKRGLGKLDLPNDFDDALRAQGFKEIPVTWDHARLNGALPWLHRGPFDRMLVAQAQAEGLTLISADPAMKQYDVPCLS